MKFVRYNSVAINLNINFCCRTNVPTAFLTVVASNIKQRLTLFLSEGVTTRTWSSQGCAPLKATNT